MSLLINSSKIYTKKSGAVSVFMGFKMQGWQREHVNSISACVYSCSGLEKNFAKVCLSIGSAY